MKLRIKGNTLRIRVSRSELARLLNGDRVEDAIQFSAAPDSRFVYGLQSGGLQSGPHAKPLEVQWTPQRVTVSIAEERMRLWADEAEVGVYGSLDLGPAGSLAVAVEKDFACLDPSDEDSSDSFANPNAACR